MQHRLDNEDGPERVGRLVNTPESGVATTINGAARQRGAHVGNRAQPLSNLYLLSLFARAPPLGYNGSGHSRQSRFGATYCQSVRNGHGTPDCQILDSPGPTRVGVAPRLDIERFNARVNRKQVRALKTCLPYV